MPDLKYPSANAYTIGNREGYDHALEERGYLEKIGREDDGYLGGWVWRTVDEAQAFIANSTLPFKAQVYGLVLPNGWEQDVSAEPEADGVHRLQVNAQIVPIRVSIAEAIKIFSEALGGSPLLGLEAYPKMADLFGGDLYRRMKEPIRKFPAEDPEDLAFHGIQLTLDKSRAQVRQGIDLKRPQVSMGYWVTPSPPCPFCAGHVPDSPEAAVTPAESAENLKNSPFFSTSLDSAPKVCVQCGNFRVVERRAVDTRPSSHGVRSDLRLVDARDDGTFEIRQRNEQGVDVQSIAYLDELGPLGFTYCPFCTEE